MKFTNWTEAEIKRWLWLRAVEWAAFPAYVSQPLVPIMLIFIPWYWVIATVVVIGMIWTLIRYSYVNVTIATIACFFVVWAKWPSAIGSAIYLFFHHQPVPALIALVWPLLGGFVGVPGKVGVIELAFAKRIGFVRQDTEGLLDFQESEPKPSGPYSGGTGKSMQDAVKITATSSFIGIHAEYVYVEMQCGQRDIDWTLELQTLLEPDGPGGKHYDLLRVKLKDGALREFYFDISSFFGK